MAEAIGQSVLGTFTDLIVGYLVVPIGRQFGYLFYYKNNIHTLTKGVKDLENMRDGVKRSVDASERNIEVVGADVYDWLKETDLIKDEADKVLQRKDEVERGCLNGWCPNLVSRYSLSRKATKKAEKIVELQGKGDKYTTLSYPSPPTEMISVSQDFKGFQSRISTKIEVMEALKDDNITMIGICGMAGVGKTTMVEELAKKAKFHNLCDEVAITTVSSNQELMKIQGDLASMLGLSLENETSLRARAFKLHTRLSNGKRILVILDDVWESLDLGKLGIPYGGGHNGCKVLLTSRNVRVCIEMGSQKNISVEILSNEEAWDLFKEISGITNETSDLLQSIAKEVANECRGLPLAIVTLAKALKNQNNKPSWNVVLRQLKKYNEMPKRVEVSVELSYNMLETNEAKSLLRLCSLFPEDAEVPIECLVRYAVGLRAIKNFETVAEARELVYSLINQLKSCYLILAGDEAYVKLHDVVRDVCISIASKDQDSYLVRCNAGLKAWPQEDTFKQYSVISLMFDELSKLPNGLDCPNLELLQLRCLNYRSWSRPPTHFGDFFEGMTQLRVVSLRTMALQLPQPSLKSMMLLRTLCLDFCQLHGDISMIGSLKTLEILSFFRSILDEEVPSEIKQLDNLRLLDFRWKEGPAILPPGVLSSLNKLEEFYNGKSFWKRAEDRYKQNASITELNSLSCLKTLKIHLRLQTMSLLKDFFFENLSTFYLSINDSFPSKTEHYSLEKYHFRNKLALCHLDMGMLFEIGFKVLLERSEIVRLKKTTGLGANLLDKLDTRHFVKWKKLRVENCDELKYLICGNLPSETNAFGNLQELRLWYLPAMKSLFPRSIAKHLVQLRELDICDCRQMDYIVTKEVGEYGIDAEPIVFPKLNFLNVWDLPMFRSFYPNSDVTLHYLFDGQVVLPSMERLHVGMIDNLVHIAASQMQAGSLDKLRVMKVRGNANILIFAAVGQLQLFQSLQDLKLEYCGAMREVFDLEGLKVGEEHAEVTLGQLESVSLHALPKLVHIWKMVPKELQGFQNLRSLVITECNSLRYLLSPTVAKLLVCLQDLELTNCEAMEEIIEMEVRVTNQEVEEIMDKIMFPQLSTLYLEDLENLTVFCSEKYEFQFPSLKRVLIQNCPKMKTFCYGLLCTPKLERENVQIGQPPVWMGDLNATIENVNEREDEE